MKRRTFLSAAGLGATAAAAWPVWLKRAFADVSVPVQSGSVVGGPIGGVAGGEPSLGKPLLVLVIPENSAERWPRGHAFGELLNHGTEAQMAPLALCEVRCATMAEMRRSIPEAGQGEPLMLLVETDGSGRVARLDEELPSDLGRRTDRSSETLVQMQRREDAIVDARIAILARLVREAVMPDDATAMRRADRVSARLSEGEVKRVESVLAQGAMPPLPEVDRGAALVARAALHAGAARREALLRRLGDAAIARLRKAPPPGAHWAQASGCGLLVEDDPEDGRMMVSCGMGHVPAKSIRFLYLFSRTPTQEYRQKEQDRKAKEREKPKGAG